MSFEETPEDKRNQHPCPYCEDGNVELESSFWECDKCNFKKHILA